MAPDEGPHRNAIRPYTRGVAYFWKAASSKCGKKYLPLTL